MLLALSGGQQGHLAPQGGLAAPGTGHGSISEECIKPLGNEKDHLSHQKKPLALKGELPLDY